MELIPAPTQDEFYTPPPNSGQTIDVNIQSKGEIVSTLYEARTTMKPEEQSAIQIADYGDLPKHMREARAMEERCWTSDKQQITQYTTKPFAVTKEDAERFIVSGTNGIACYALEAISPTAVASVKQYKDDMIQFECASVYRGLQHQLKHLKTSKEAKDMLTTVVALTKTDPLLKPAVKKIGAKLSQKIKSLPEHVNQPPGRNVTVEPRPGGEYPEIMCILHPLGVEPSGDKLKEDNPKGTPLGNNPEGTPPQAPPESDIYAIWTCCVKDQDAPWKRTNDNSFTVASHTIPTLAMNTEYLAVIYQPPHVNAEMIYVDLYKLTSMGRPQKALYQRFPLTFPIDKFGTDGILTAHLSVYGILSIGFSSGVIVFDAMRQVVDPRAICLHTDNPKNKRRVTSVRVEHDVNHSRPESYDLWEEAATKETMPVPPWSGVLVIGSSAGEIFGICWRSGNIVFADHTPAVEPIFNVLYSNRRVIMQTARAINGRLTPYATEAMTHMPIGRPLSVAVCGTLMFSLEKYGTIHVLSTVARRMIFPFKPLKDVETGLTWVYPPFYQGIFASNDKVVVLYPNGVTRVMSIRPRAIGLIDERVKEKKKKNGKR